VPLSRNNVHFKLTNVHCRYIVTTKVAQNEEKKSLSIKVLASNCVKVPYWLVHWWLILSFWLVHWWLVLRVSLVDWWLTNQVHSLDCPAESNWYLTLIDIDTICISIKRRGCTSQNIYLSQFFPRREQEVAFNPLWFKYFELSLNHLWIFEVGIQRCSNVISILKYSLWIYWKLPICNVPLY